MNCEPFTHDVEKASQGMKCCCKYDKGLIKN